jgi:starch synthase
MTNGNKVLFITQEIVPYVATSEVAELGRNLAQSIQEQGYEIRTFMPKWGTVNERRNQLHEVIRLSGINIIIDDTDHPLIIKVASIPSARMQIYFIDNDDYFQNKSQTVNKEGVEYEDNDCRTIFYARGVLETVKKLHWVPDIVHCEGWISALVPLYIKRAFKDEPSFRDTKVVFSLFEEELKTPFPTDYLTKLQIKGVTKKSLAPFAKNFNFTSLCKLAVEYADGVMVCSEHVNEEVMAYAKKQNKPILEYQPLEKRAEATDAFYKQLLEADAAVTE